MFNFLVIQWGAVGAITALLALIITVAGSFIKLSTKIALMSSEINDLKKELFLLKQSESEEIKLLRQEIIRFQIREEEKSKEFKKMLEDREIQLFALLEKLNHLEITTAVVKDRIDQTGANPVIQKIG
jgi:hypothetical protein